MPTDEARDDIYIDANGRPTERIRVGDQEVVVHYDDIPESDITTVRGLRVTTPIRTVIDIAPDMPSTELERIIRDCLGRGLFTVEEALARINQPDMAARVGAQMVRSALTGRELPGRSRGKPQRLASAGRFQRRDPRNPHH